MATTQTTNGHELHHLAVIGALLLILFTAALALSGVLSRAIFRGRTAVPEAVPLSVADVHVDGVTEDSAVVTWRTTAPADSQIMYGKGEERDHATPRRPEFALDHKVTIASLESGTTYGFTVVSADKSGLIVSAAGPGFRTGRYSILAPRSETPSLRPGRP